MKTITIDIPAKTIKLSKGTRQVPARVETITISDDGKYAIAFDGSAMPITETEAIDVCRKGRNWDAIRREHFAMAGFHA